jgi:hypothetical protein
VPDLYPKLVNDKLFTSSVVDVSVADSVSLAVSSILLDTWLYTIDPA